MNSPVGGGFIRAWPLDSPLTACAILSGDAFHMDERKGKIQENEAAEEKKEEASDFPSSDAS